MAGEWLAQVSDDLKENEALTSYETVSDFAKAHVDTLGRVSELDGKVTESTGKITDLEERLTNSIPRLTENSTDEEKAAYYTALGVPADKAEYEFPKTEGVEQDEAMMNFARDMFHAAGVSKESAAKMVPLWDKYQVELSKAFEESQVKADEEATATADAALKEEWKADYDKNIEMTRRGYQAFEKIVPGFSDLLKIKMGGGITVGNDPRMLKVFHAIGGAIGDDFSLPGRPSGEEAKKLGFQGIYKVPNPPTA